MAIHLLSPVTEPTQPLQLHKRNPSTTYAIRRISDGTWWSTLLGTWVADRELATTFAFYTAAALLGSMQVAGSVTLWEVVALYGDAQ